jgi:hypothetical protein
MEEIEENVGEQPETLGSPEENSEQTEVASEQSEAERGVPIGKFKSVDDLYHAYNSLQSEFTKKCQRLAEIEKDKTPLPSQEKLNDEFKAFLLENQEAYSFADEIKQRVFSDENLMSVEKPFDKVWASVVYEKLKSQDNTKEPMVRALILNDEKIKNLVIQNYMEGLADKKAPFVMSSETGEKVAQVVTSKPDSFEQAKKVVLDLLS